MTAEQTSPDQDTRRDGSAVERGVVPLEPERDGFAPDELQLGYTAWTRLSESRRKHLSAGVRAWLGAWNLWDLACSPMDDKERRLIRYGHYLGWWDRRDHHERHNVRTQPAPTAAQEHEDEQF
jgi:hypothetical protein